MATNDQSQSRPFICRCYSIIILCLSALQLQHTMAQSSQPSPSPPDGFGTFGSGINPTMAVVMVILVASFFLMGFFSVYIRQCAYRRLGRRYDPNFVLLRGGRLSRTAARGLDAEVIESFPTFLYSIVKGVKIGQDSLECAICLNEFQDDETLRLIPNCNHVFHPDCIDSWLASHVTCPVCRANLALQPSEVFPNDLVQDAEPVVQDGNMAEEENQVSIRVDQGKEELALLSPSKIASGENPFRSKSTGSTWRFNKAPVLRSQSTGNLLVQSDERFTLRLSEEVRHQLLNSNLNRSRSCVAFPRVTSTRKGYRRSGTVVGTWRSSYLNDDRFDQSEPWRFKLTPPFFTRTRSVGTNVYDGEQSSDHLRASSRV
ncbi:hypothetical protein ACFE04_012632 [Oxalis oulophora]